MQKSVSAAIRNRTMILGLLLAWLLPASAEIPKQSGTPLKLTAEEKAWLAAHPVIRLGVDPGFAPYAFIDAQGRPAGIASELTALVGERLGVRLELVAGLNWPEILAAARQRKIDVITTATFRPERLEYLNFTRPYLTTPLVVMTRAEARQIRDLKQLNRLKVALVKDYASTRAALERFPGIDALLVANPLAGLNALSEGRAEAYIGVLGINTYLASRNGITNIKVNTGFDMSNHQSYGVRKDWPELVPLLEKALDSIPAWQQQAIFARWISVPVESIVLPAAGLDPQFREPVADVPPLTEPALEVIAAIPRDAPPNYQIGSDGRPGGFAIEMMELIARHAHVSVRYVVENNWSDTIDALRTGRADLIPNLGITEGRREDFAFSAPVETFRLSIFVRNDSVGISGYADLHGRHVAVVRANAAEDILKSRADVQATSYSDFPDALFALLSGNVDALVYPEPWTWKRAKAARVADQIKVVGDPIIELKRALAMRRQDADLFARLDTAVTKALTSPEYRVLYAKWIGTPEPYWTTVRLAWTAGGLFVVTVLVMGVWRYRSTALAYRALKTTQAERDRTEARRQAVFETAAVSLWEEDISAIRRLLEARRPAAQTGWVEYFDEHPEFVVDCARALQVLDVNQATIDLYEAKTKQELLGSIERIFTDESYGVFKQELVAIAEGRTYFSTEAFNRTLSGKKIWIVISLSIPRMDSPTQRMVAAVLDISELKQIQETLRRNEERFSAMIDVSPVPYALNDDHDNITYLNPAFVEAFGYTKEDIPTLADWWPKAYPDPEYRLQVIADWDERLRKAERGEATFEPMEITIQCKHGAHRTVIASAAPIGGSWSGEHLVILYDITDRKFVETEREQLLKEVTERNIEMENFIYTISHDLKAPIITIDGFAKLMSKDLSRNDKERCRDSLAEIHAAAAGMLHLIEDLLTLSRTGNVIGEVADVDLNALLNDVRARCTSQIEHERATIRVNGQLPRVRADRDRIGQVLQNLLENAIKFHRPGVAPEIDIGTERAPGELRIYVRDNGIGIEERYQEKIFGLFQRLDTRVEGTGVGLTIARRVVEQHGGRLTVDSAPGRGSTFWISLPDSVMVNESSDIDAGIRAQFTK